MKKIATIMGLFGLIFVQAQVGINQDEPKATLDIKAEKTDGSQVEGFLMPRISKKAAHTMAVATTKPQESNMVYVNDLSATFTAPTGDTTVSDITEKGYYFWNGSKWAKTAGKDGAEWIYDPVTKQTNLKRSGTAPFTNMVYFDETGRFFNTKGINENVFRGNNYIASGTNMFTTNFSGLKNSNSINIDYFEAKDTPTSSTLPNDHVFRQESFFAVDDAAVDKHAYDTFSSGADYVYTKPGMLKNLHALVGKQTRIASLSDINLEVMSGGRSTVYLKEGKVLSIDGYSSFIELNSNKGSNTSNGFYANIESLKGVHNSLVGVRGRISVSNSRSSYVIGLASNTVLGESSDVTTLDGVRVFNKLRATTVAAKIGSLRGIYVDPHYVSPGSLSPNITDAYGMLIEDVNLGKTSNYAIYTKAGKNSFGDAVEIRNINTNTSTNSADKVVVADATTGELKVKEASDLAGAEWVYNSTTKQTNLKRSGTAPFTNMVYFDETGRFFNTKGINENVFRGNNYIASGTNMFTTNFSGLKNSNSINIDYFEAKDTPTSSTLPNDHVFRQESFFAVDDAAVDKHAYDTFSSGADYVYTKPGMLKNLHALVGKQTRIANLADVDVGVMSGGRSTVYLKEGKASTLDGYSSFIELNSNKGSDTSNGFYANIESLKGTHNSLVGVRGRISVSNSSSNYVSGLVSNPILGGGVVVTNLNGARIVNQFGADVNTVAPQIGTLKGIYVHPHHVLPSTLSPDITHAYGIEIEDVTLGTASNYAIYTKAGKVRLGDDVTIGTTAAPKKLEVSGKIKAANVIFTGIPTYANDADAATGGLVAGEMYKTSTGELRIKL